MKLGHTNNPGPRVKCLKCLDIVQSLYRHDFKWCACQSIAVDGGRDYLKMSYKPGAEYEVLDDETGSDLKVGDLVELFVDDPQDGELATTPLHTGIFIDGGRNAADGAWLILVDGKIGSYFKQWWSCKKLEVLTKKE